MNIAPWEIIIVSKKEGTKIKKNSKAIHKKQTSRSEAKRARHLFHCMTEMWVTCNAPATFPMSSRNPKIFIYWKCGRSSNIPIVSILHVQSFTKSNCTYAIIFWLFHLPKGNWFQNEKSLSSFWGQWFHCITPNTKEVILDFQLKFEGAPNPAFSSSKCLVPYCRRAILQGRCQHQQTDH